jgi:hypothetical protein
LSVDDNWGSDGGEGMSQPDVLTLKEAAEYLRLSKETTDHALRITQHTPSHPITILTLGDPCNGLLLPVRSLL